MNENLQDIVERLETMKIGVDEPFRFHCTMCGECCMGRQDILLNPKDIYGIAGELGLTPKRFLYKYCEAYIGDSSRVPVVRLKPCGEGEPCPLLVDKRCSIHKVKPTICAMFPIGRVLKVETDSILEEEITADQIQYIFTNPGCGDETEGHTVREWLDRFEIPLEDEFFIRWQGTVLKLSRIFREIEDVMDKDIMEMLRAAVLAGLYLNYDTEKAFMPQFKNNVQQVLEIMCMESLKEGDWQNPSGFCGI